MRGAIVKRGRSYRYNMSLGDQPVQVCGPCGRSGTFWTTDEPLSACPRCGGELRSTLRRRQVWSRTYPDRATCERELHDALSAHGRGNYVVDSSVTLGAYLSETWLPSIKGHVRPTTFENYGHLLRRHVLPVLGAVRLQDVTPARYNALDGILSGEKGLSASTRRQVYAILHKAFKDAVRDDLIARSPLDKVSGPKVARHRDLDVWAPEQSRAFLHSLDGDRYAPLFHLAITTGARRGELLALRRSDLDLDAGIMWIRRSLVLAAGKPMFAPTKSGKARGVALDPATVAVLRSHMRRQAEERLALGEGYSDSALVFAHEDGTLVRPDWISRRFQALVKVAKLPHIRFHDLRHGYAAAAVKAGIPIKVLSERLGHATIAITMDVYASVLPGMDADAADKVAALILGA